MLKQIRRFSPMLAIALVLGNTAVASALQPGNYWGGGSRYIRIVRQGNRFCYHGFSPNGSTVASVLPIRNQPGVYRVHGMKSATLSQTNAQTLWFSSAPYKRDGNSGLTAELQQCLNSRRPYFSRENYRR